jgi:hypothetical protein
MLVWLTTPFEEEGMLMLMLVLGYWLELASTGKLKLEENSMTCDAINATTKNMPLYY